MRLQLDPWEPENPPPSGGAAVGVVVVVVMVLLVLLILHSTQAEPHGCFGEGGGVYSSF